MKRSDFDLLLWLLLALPAVVFSVEAARTDDIEALLHPTGEMSARLIIVALALTPLSLILPRNRTIAWVRARRRAFGVAAFGYAVLHTTFYVVAMGNLDDMLAELSATGIWTGWLALALLVPLAITSTDQAMRVLGQAWKRLQRLAYPAALLTLVHWIAVHNGVGVALAHFVPLALLESYRLFRNFHRAPSALRSR